jgi:hypothetical protein
MSLVPYVSEVPSPGPVHQCGRLPNFVHNKFASTSPATLVSCISLGVWSNVAKPHPVQRISCTALLPC